MQKYLGLCYGSQYFSRGGICSTGSAFCSLDTCHLCLAYGVCSYSTSLRKLVTSLLLLQGNLGQGCKAQVKTKQKQYEVAAQRHARQFGKALGLSAADLLWGLGTVSSMVCSHVLFHGTLFLCNVLDGLLGSPVRLHI